jgi:hypothetical protein
VKFWQKKATQFLSGVLFNQLFWFNFSFLRLALGLPFLQLHLLLAVVLSLNTWNLVGSEKVPQKLLEVSMSAVSFIGSN